MTLKLPPLTPAEPVTEILHGVPVTDPYRWLEDQNSPRTRKWLEEQTVYTRTYLDAIPGRDRIRKRVEELSAVEVVSEPWKVGNRYFYLKRTSHGEQPAIVTRDREEGKEVCLVDPIERDPSGATSVRILSVSERGDFLAYEATSGGDGFHVIEFIDVTRNMVLPDRLPLGVGFGLVFSSDGRGFYYSHEVVGARRPYHRGVYWHEFGSSPDKDPEIFFGGDEAHLHVELSGSPDARFLVYRVIRAQDPQAYRVYVQDMLSGRPPRKLLEQTGITFVPCFFGLLLFAMTDWAAPNLRVVACDLSDSERSEWVDVVAEGQHRLSDFCIVDDLVCVARVEGLSIRIDAFDRSGRWRKTVPCPPRSTIRLFRRPSKSDTLFYGSSSYNQPPTIISWRPSSDQQNTWARAHVPFDPSSREVEQTWYRSKDGTQIPITLVTKKGRLPCQSSPTFLIGYGGYGSSRILQFSIYSTLLIEKGFLFALPSLRGGGEFGAEWHRAGKRHQRQTAIDDFIGAAEWLIKAGYATPEKMAIGGMSNGGLLVGAAMTQRPDLFRVVVCVAPMLDMLRYHLFDDSIYNLVELGYSENEEDFRHLLAYSPYHRVTDNGSYPSVLIVSGDVDRCCNPMHARKMAARLQAASTSGHPVLLDYKETRGHLALQPLSRRIEALTDRLAFICHELGVTV